MDCTRCEDGLVEVEVEGIGTGYDCCDCPAGEARMAAQEAGCDA